MSESNRHSDAVPRFSIFVLILLVLQSCASGLNRRLDQKLEREPDISTQKDLQSKAERWIQGSKILSPDQKRRLDELKNTTNAEMREISETSLKLHSILITDLLKDGSPSSSDEPEREIKMIESRLGQLEHRRFEIIFRAVAQANSIVGRSGIDQEWIDQAVFFPHGGGE